MKKLIYFVFVIATIYLGIMYKWKESIWLLSAEIVFPFLCFGMAWIGGRRMEWNIVLLKDTAEKGENIPLKIQIRNKSRLPSVVQVVGLYRYISGEEQKRIRESVYVPAKKSGQLETHIPAKYCGKIEVSISKSGFCYWGIYFCRKKI